MNKLKLHPAEPEENIMESVYKVAIEMEDLHRNQQIAKFTKHMQGIWNTEQEKYNVIWNSFSVQTFSSDFFNVLITNLSS